MVNNTDIVKYYSHFLFVRCVPIQWTLAVLYLSMFIVCGVGLLLLKTLMQG